MLATRPDIQVTSNLSGRQVDLSLDENSTAHLMGLFIDLYSDQEKAVIREYSTNALDSHVEAGTDRPIEVTLPSQWEPQLRIRDYGIGLSESDIENIYSKYGASTKRETDDQVGMLGLGCKSALTYTNQFTVVGIKYGIKTTVSISREDNGGGSMVIVDSSPTDEPTGVEVIVPVDTVSSFKEKAASFFQFWPEGSVLVNGEMPQHIEGFQVEDDLRVVKGFQDYVVMGNVPYPADLTTGLRHGYSLVAYVPIGSVNFTPSREALQYTQNTKDSLATIEEAFKTYVVRTAQDEIALARTPGQALRTAMDWRERLDGRTHKIDLTYKGESIPEFVTAKFLITSKDSYKLSTHNTVNQIATSYVAQALFVHSYTNNFTGAHKKKLNMYQSENGLSFEHYLLCEDQIDSKWMEGATWVDWADIKALKLPTNRTYGGGNRGNGVTGSYKEAYVNGTFTSTLTASEIDTSKPVFYTTDISLNDSASGLITAHKPGGYTLVYLTPNRVNKFTRDFPMAREPWEFLAKVHRRLATKITREDRLVNVVKGCYESDVYQMLDANQIDDPAIKEAIRLVSAATPAKLEEWDKFRNLRYKLGTTDLTLEEIQWESPLTNYPLCPRDSFHFRRDTTKLNHLYLYLNAAFAATKENK